MDTAPTSMTRQRDDIDVDDSDNIDDRRTEMDGWLDGWRLCMALDRVM